VSNEVDWTWKEAVMVHSGYIVRTQRSSFQIQTVLAVNEGFSCNLFGYKSIALLLHSPAQFLTCWENI
jgi:hypothetical protein